MVARRTGHARKRCKPDRDKKASQTFSEIRKAVLHCEHVDFRSGHAFCLAYSGTRYDAPRAIEDAPEATVTPPGGADYVIVVEFSGCRDREAKDKLTQYAVDKDDAAFNSAWEEYASTGECVILKVGTAVFVVDSAIFRGLVKLRPAGSTDEYWTEMESIHGMHK